MVKKMKDKPCTQAVSDVFDNMFKECVKLETYGKTQLKKATLHVLKTGSDEKLAEVLTSTDSLDKTTVEVKAIQEAQSFLIDIRYIKKALTRAKEKVIPTPYDSDDDVRYGYGR